ncbi:hypothetical protein D3C72_984420 [compost metagenome]
MWVLRLSIGWPIGTLMLSSGWQVQWVTSIAASVGPYRLYRPAAGRRCRVWRASSAGNASPLHTTRLRLMQLSTASWVMNACSIDGTKCSVLMP